MTTSNINGDYAQAGLCVLDAIADVIKFGVPKKATELHDILESALDAARAQLERITASTSHQDFCKKAFHIKGQMQRIENTINAEARRSIAIVIKRYVEAVINLLEEMRNDFLYDIIEERQYACF
ncbi:MAG: hypothetical protein AB7E29_08380 [Xanthobacter sp.]